MDVGTQETRPIMKGEKKRQKDKERKRPGKCQKKRLHVLQNPAKLAFRGWESEAEPWSLATTEVYIEWCHISKLFPLARHQVHRHSSKANLKFCLNKDFANRCVTVFQFLYRQEIMKRCEAPLFICRMVYAEVILHKVVDWSTIKSTPAMVHLPTEKDIPQVISLFPSGALERALERAKKVEVEEPVIATDSSELDSDSDGKRVQKTYTVPLASGLRKRRRGERVVATTSVDGGQVGTGGHMATTVGVANEEPNVVAEQVDRGAHVEAIQVEAQPTKDVDSHDLKAQLEAKDLYILQLKRDIEELLDETRKKSLVIAMLREEINSRDAINDVEVGVQEEPRTSRMEVDEDAIDNVVSIATYGVVEESPQQV
jgi:hypothetical protein